MIWLWLGVIIVFGGYHTYLISRAKPQWPAADAEDAATLETGSAAETHRGVGTSLPGITFLVPAWNAASDIPEFIAAYRALTLERKQLVVCAGGSDNSYDIALQYSSNDIIVMEQPKGMGKQGALRASYPGSEYDLIYLTDIDCRPTDAVVQQMVAALSDSECECATGSIRPLALQAQSAFVRVQWAIERVVSLRMQRYVSGLRGANAVITRAAIESAGAFGQEAMSGTDYTLAKELEKNGHRIAFVQGAEMATEYPETWRLYVKKQARWLRNILILGMKYGVRSEVRAVLVTLLAPVAYVLLLGAGLLWHPLVLIVALAVAHASLNRIRYGKVADVSVTYQAALKSVLADLAAALRAGYQSVMRDYSW